MCDYEKELKLAFAKARTYLAQIMSVRYTLQTLKDEIIEPCSKYYIDRPSAVCFIGEEYTKEIQELFKPFSSFYDDFKPDYTCGHLFNMSVVFSVDSVIQVLLDSIYVVFYDRRKWTEDNLKNSIGWKKAKLKNSISLKIEALFGKEGLIKKDSIVIESDSIKFLEQLRHLVTHCGGIVDSDFYLNCGINPMTKKPDDSKRKLSLLNLPDSIEEKDISNFCNYFKIDQQVGIPIEKLVRLTKEALIFIDKIEDICLREL